MRTRALCLSAAIELLALCLAITACGASEPKDPGYLPVRPPQPTAAGDKVEVLEFFNYGCVHCFEFQPAVDAWLKTADKSQVQFRYVPAPFNPLFNLFARGYFAADSMGVAASTHHQVFEALFKQGKRVNNIDDMAALYESLGVDRKQFMKVALSFFVEDQIKRAEELTRAHGVTGTPTVIVAGKYRVDGDTAGSNELIFKVVDKLVAQERAAKK
jgi:protein dithiol oxidoreductase (disulfide-forming)